jgi:hypothetical protein
LEEGRKKGIEEGMKKGLSPKDISELTGLTVDELLA